MTPPTAPDAATDRQTVGDILLARGYIKRDQLDQAIGSQQQSGKPLGQVLVEAGAITRLELASALAEQWSDTATWLGPPDEIGRTRPRSAPGTPRRARCRSRRRKPATRSSSRTRSSSSAAASPPSSPQLTDLKLRLESGRGRRTRQADRPDRGRAGRRDRARPEARRAHERRRARLHIGRAKLRRAGRRDRRAGRHGSTSPPIGRPSTTSAAPCTSWRPGRRADPAHGDPGRATLAGQLDELRETAASRADPTALDALRSAVDELASQVRRADSPALDERSTSVAGPRSDDRPESGWHDRPRCPSEPRAAGCWTSCGRRWRGARGPARSRPALAERLEELTARIEALAGSDALETVRNAVEELAGRPAADPALTARIDDLAARLDETAGALETRAEAAALEELREALGTRVEHECAGPLAGGGRRV